MFGRSPPQNRHRAECPTSILKGADVPQAISSPFSKYFLTALVRSVAVDVASIDELDRTISRAAKRLLTGMQTDRRASRRHA
jgi:hypothetical protein